jgi:hypothetical protein
MKYYIGERHNPQFVKPYYRAYGQLSAKDARKKEDCLYGSRCLTGYKTKKEYIAEIERLKNEGYSCSEF